MEIQDKFNKSNHIYKITNDIDLNGTILNLPYNSVLDFQGGILSNGTVVLNNTKILPNGCLVKDYISASIEGSYAKGQCLFDTTLNKPIWWTGEKWVDATGTEV